MSLDGRRAVVTGGGRGIGEAIARKLAADGAQVVVAGRDRSSLEAAATAIGGVALCVDLSSRTDTDRFVTELAELGPIDILVNNAGVADSAPLADTDDASWDRQLELNATAPFRLCRALIPGMVERGWGRVVNLASNAGLTGYAYTTGYCASKHAVVGLTRALAVEVATRGVTVNAVCPGFVDTEMTTATIENIVATTGRDAAAARAALERMSPQRRLMTTGEVAHAVAMLCSDDARGIHGQALVIDGGAVLT